MTLLIKGVHILCGPADCPDRCDVFVSGDKVSAIGRLPNKRADTVIEGQGANLAPGFIDVHTDSDHYLTLFSNPGQEDFLKQGVTTIVGGHCGVSLAPLIYGSLESLDQWIPPHRLNVAWHTMRELVNVLARQTLGVNFASLAGHTTVRRAVVGDASPRPLTARELAVLSSVLTRALSEGGCGISTDSRAVRDEAALRKELAALGRITHALNAVLAVHVYNGSGDMARSAAGFIKTLRFAHTRGLLGHLMPLTGHEHDYEAAMELIENAPRSMEVYFDVHPFETSVVPLGAFLPQWAKEGSVEDMAARVLDEWTSRRVKDEFPSFDPNELVVVYAPKNDELVGRSLMGLMVQWGVVDSDEALLRLMRTTRLCATAASSDVAVELLYQALSSRRSLIASNAAAFGPVRGVASNGTEQATSTFTRFLALVAERNMMPIEAAVRKITAIPAKLFGIVKRGEVKEGNFADLVVFKGNEIRHVIVNGQAAVREGVCLGTRAGRPLRHSVA